MAGEHFLEPIGRLFYIVSPNRTSFQKIRDVPNYADGDVPNILTLFIIEIALSILTKRGNIRLNDTISCFCNGILMELFRIFAPGGQLITYVYIYKNWRVVDLPWNSLWTWWSCFLIFDFMYYCGHRAVHSVNILWATHHIHHSSEDYNISTNIRQSILQHFFLWVLYLPVAFFVPITVYLVHAQLNYIYQFWIHTELIKSLGPLEYILNTPSHHRVHHGRNRIAIDKNFGGTLIIWDRIFGTFEPEKEEMLYGLTHPINTFDLLKIQFEYCVHIWKTFWSYNGIKNKLSVLVKGPGWSPGKPWLGDIKDVPDVKAPVPKYDIQLSLWCKIYLIWHFLILVQAHLGIMESYYILPRPLFWSAILFELFSLVSICILLEKKSYFAKIEIMRILLFFVLHYYLINFLEWRQHRVSLSNFQARWIPEELVHLAYFASLLFCFIYGAIETSNKKDVLLKTDLMQKMC